MKKIFYAAALFAMAFAVQAQAQPLAKEIAFARGCEQGVPLYNSTDGKVACGTLPVTGMGYVIEMATTRAQAPSCPAGYNYIGNLDTGSLMARGIAAETALQYFACAKG